MSDYLSFKKGHYFNNTLSLIEEVINGHFDYNNSKDLIEIKFLDLFRCYKLIHLLNKNNLKKAILFRNQSKIRYLKHHFHLLPSILNYSDLNLTQLNHFKDSYFILSFIYILNLKNLVIQNMYIKFQVNDIGY